MRSLGLDPGAWFVSRSGRRSGGGSEWRPSAGGECVWVTWAASTTRRPSNEPSSDNSPDGTSWELTHNN